MGLRALSCVFLGVLLASSAAFAGERPAQPVVPDSLPVATDARLGGDEAQTRFVMDLSRKIDLHAFTLADPYRVILDIPQVVFRLPPKSGEGGRGMITAYRFGLVMQGGSRMVFDLAKPVRIEKAFVVDATDGAPARLVLDLAATDRENFLRRIALDNRVARSEPPATNVPEPASGDPRPLVVLDPGHGGIDTGTRAASGELEKDIVLDFTQRLREHIEKLGKYRVLMTRTDDTFVPLGERVRIARNAGAALFVSIHADALPHGEGDAQGASVYTVSDTASDSEAARLAEKENRADVIAGVDLKAEPDDVADILIDLAQRETQNRSVTFARSIVGELAGKNSLHTRKLRSAGFRVLKAPDIPSVLLELGFLSNPDDEKRLTSDAWRDNTAAAVAESIDVYFAKRIARNPY